MSRLQLKVDCRLITATTAILASKTDNSAGLEPRFTASVRAEANFDVLVTPEAKMGIKSNLYLIRLVHDTDTNCSQPQLNGRSACWLSK